MKKWRKAYTLACSLIAMMLMLAGCGETKVNILEQTLVEAEEINNNSELGMDFLQLSTLSEEQAKRYNDDQPELEFTDDGCVTGYYYRYPSTEGERRLTQISVIGGNYHVFGICTGGSFDAAVNTLTQRGYEEIELTIQYNGLSMRAFQKYDVIIRIETIADSSVIGSIQLYVDAQSSQQQGYRQ